MNLRMKFLAAQERARQSSGGGRGIDRPPPRPSPDGRRDVSRYSIKVWWSAEDDCYVGEVPELPGCMTDGKTRSSCIRSLEQAARSWLEVAKKRGVPLPQPRIGYAANHDGRPCQLFGVKPSRKLLGLGCAVTFKSHVYKAPYAPYYDAYKGHVFVIDHYHPDKDAWDHVWLTCVDDPTVKVKGYVELDDLKESR